ncbi:MAG: recombinase RecT [Gammaproteobacteria bacterium]|nr:recombinase RecT [Gammaproteobacteria bacterium]
MSQAKDFPALLKQYSGEIVKALPQHINATRMERMCMTSFHKNPKLKECDPISVMSSVIQACQLGLEPDLLGRSFLVPYKGKCQFVPGWRGLVHLAHNSGKMTVWTGVVFDGDFFEYQFGDEPYCHHRPGDEIDVAKLLYVYAIGKVKGMDQKVIEVWTKKKVEKHRDRYNKVGTSHYSYDNFEMYARKVVLLQVLKYLPTSADMSRAMELNDAAEIGTQHLNIDGSYRTFDDPGQGGGEKEVPVLTAEEFNKKKDGWRNAVLGGQDPAEVITFIETKTTLTDEQKFEIDSWKDQRAEK